MVRVLIGVSVKGKRKMLTDGLGVLGKEEWLHREDDGVKRLELNNLTLNLVTFLAYITDHHEIR